MKSSLLVLLAFVALCAAGCRSDANRELLEREIRSQSDQIYQLQDQFDDAQHQLEARQRELDGIKKVPIGGGIEIHGSAEPPRIEVPDAIIQPPDDRPRRRTDQNRFPPLPKIERPAPTPPDQKSPGPAIPLDQHSGADNSEDPGEAPRAGAGSSAASFSPGDAASVRRIALNRFLTAGHQFGEHPGDDGLVVVFSPRDADDRPVPIAGDVSIAVLDPEFSGKAGRVARWDFSAADAAKHYRPTSLAAGYHFELLWPDNPPEHERLKFYRIRLTMPDGRKFETNQIVQVAMASTSPKWTRSDGVRSWEFAPSPPAGGQFDPASEAQQAANSGPLKPIPAAAADNASDSAAAKPSTARKGAVWSPYR